MVGDKIKECRKRKGLTREQLADALGIQARTLGSYEQETRSLPLDTLTAIADYFNVTTDYLLGRDMNRQEIPEPTSIAAHETSDMKPISEDRIKELIAEAFSTFVKNKAP